MNLTANDWNAMYPIGTPVRYWPVVDCHHWPASDPIDTRTRSEAFTLGHEKAMVMIDLRAGGVSLDHVMPRILLGRQMVAGVASGAMPPEIEGVLDAGRELATRIEDWLHSCPMCDRSDPCPTCDQAIRRWMVAVWTLGQRWQAREGNDGH